MSKPDEDQLNPAPSVLIPDTVLQDRYRIVRQLGKGGMGAVYEALDQRLGITVALKETLSSEVSARKQFAQEARLLAGLQHPALPRVSDHFTEGNRAFLVMQFISGVDLAKIIVQQPGPFPRDQVVAWADQLLDALIYLHSQDRQVIHRDIKPHNLKVTVNGQIALLDFGLAKAQTTDASSGNSLASFFGYTRQYAPLEQIQGLSTGPQSDIYALGATLYYLLTGNRPVDAVTREAALTRGQADPLKRANEIHPQVGRELAAILHRAMAPNPEDRYSSANEFREMLRQIGRPSRRTTGNLEVTVSPKAIFDSKNDITILKSELDVSSSVSGGLLAAVLLTVIAIGGVWYAFRIPPDSSDLRREDPHSSPVPSQLASQGSVNTDHSRSRRHSDSQAAGWFNSNIQT